MRKLEMNELKRWEAKMKIGEIKLDKNIKTLMKKH